MQRLLLTVLGSMLIVVGFFAMWTSAQESDLPDNDPALAEELYARGEPCDASKVTDKVEWEQVASGWQAIQDRTGLTFDRLPPVDFYGVEVPLPTDAPKDAVAAFQVCVMTPDGLISTSETGAPAMIP